LIAWAAGRGQQHPVATPQRHPSAAPGKHAQLMAQDQDLAFARDFFTLAASGEKTQQAADGEVDKR
jgi:hypothetical protein